MRKFITPDTLATAQKAVAAQITNTEKGPELLALYLAEKELTDAIAAATKEPEPTPTPAKRSYVRKSKGDAAPTPEPGLEPQP